MTAYVWLLYGPQDPDCGHDPLLGVFDTPEQAGEALYEHDEKAREFRGQQPEKWPPKPYPYEFHDACWWYSPWHYAGRHEANAHRCARVAGARRGVQG